MMDAITDSADAHAAAVYTYLRALRARGITRINTVDVASALGLPIGDVEAAIEDFEMPGVRRLDEASAKPTKVK